MNSLQKFRQKEIAVCSLQCTPECKKREGITDAEKGVYGLAFARTGFVCDACYEVLCKTKEVKKIARTLLSGGIER